MIEKRGGSEQQSTIKPFEIQKGIIIMKNMFKKILSLVLCVVMIFMIGSVNPAYAADDSRQIIDSVPYHEKVIASCDVMLRELNPSFKKEKEQEEKIGLLEQKMNGMEGTLTDIREMLSLALNKSKKNEL